MPEDRSISPAIKLFAFLIVVDIALISLHGGLGLARHAGWISSFPKMLKVSTDWSLGEIFNYLKWIGIISVFVQSYRRTSENIMAVLAILFALILLDDSMQIHERTGAWLFEVLGSDATSPGWIRAALGTVAWFGIGVFGVVLITLSWRATPAELLRRLLPCVWIMAGIVVFGVGVDFVHYLMEPGVLESAVGILEDGGEMIGISCLLAYVFAAFGAPRR